MEFPFQNDNELTHKLHEAIEEDGRLHMVTSDVVSPEGEKILFLRLAICHQFTDEGAMDFAYEVIDELFTKMGHPKKAVIASA